MINIFYPFFGFSYRIIEELTLTFVVLVLLYYGKWLLQKLGLMVLLLLNFNFKFTVQFPTPSCYPLREKCPYSEFFWVVFSFIRTDYGQMLRISPYLVWMKENTNQKNSDCGHFSSSGHSTIISSLVCHINRSFVKRYFPLPTKSFNTFYNSILH